MDVSDRRIDHSDAEARRPIVNTHVHLPPNFSAFDTAEQAARLAAAEGLVALGTSNFQDFGVYPRFAAAAAESGVVALFGVEIITLVDDLPGGGMLVNDPTNLDRMYLCGKAITSFAPPSPAAARRMAAMRAANDARMRRMTELIAACFARAGLPAGETDERIATSVAERCGVPVAWVALQERHVAQAFQELLFRAVAPDDRAAVFSRLFALPTRLDPTDAAGLQEAIRSNLMKAGKPAFVPEAAVAFDDAYRLILELGGIPCYPILADGASPICQFEDPPEALVRRLKDRGIHCAELIPGRNRREVVDRYVTVLREAGIVVMAGTEHNTQRMISLEPTALGGEPLSDLAREAFWEAACVVAAHQSLARSGAPGYVDGDGRLAAGFADGEARIRSFSAIGAELMTGRSAARIQG
ncbi:MAG: hypothetical protein ACXWPJ_00800 [Candidatus Limnocylindrales bacterium]